MKNEIKILDAKQIENYIFSIRNLQVIIDKDLAELYEVETKALNQAVKRNLNRFPDSFRFQLTEIEKNGLVTNCDRFKNLKHSSSLPFAFTEQGVAMLSAVLRSDKAVEVSIQIMATFVKMRNFISQNAHIFHRLDNIETKQIEHKIESDMKFNKLFDALESNSLQQKQGIFFDRQLFDAYVFISKLIKKANKSIVLIDNFVDETVLTLFSKRRKRCKVIIYTEKISEVLKLDLIKHNKQYPPIEIKIFTKSHDRFLILDEEEIYHLGASLKDLGTRWFAFSKMDKSAFEILDRLKEAKDIK